MILPAQTIKALKILTPCEPRTTYNGVTYGLGPASYDLRIANSILLWPGSSVRVDAIERFNMPDDVMGFLYSKSTWARLHIEQAGTVIDPGWRGVLRLEINMHSDPWFYKGWWWKNWWRRWIHGPSQRKPIMIGAGTGVVQVVFHSLLEATDIPYTGKYQDQKANQDAIL